MSNGIHLRKYGVQTTIDFQLFEIDGVDFRVDAVHAAGDSLIMKDEGVEANTDNAFTDEGNGYSIVLSATEMEAARIVGYLIDQTVPKAWLDTAFTIETYGNASAMHAVDLDDSVRAGLTALPNAAADANNGLVTGDGNATFTAGVGNRIAVDVEALGGTVQSATDLKDFADAGYDPGTNQVEGVKLVDTTTVNTDMEGTDNAALAATALTDATWTDARAAFLDELAAANIPADIDTLLGRVTAAVALASVCTEGRLSELDGANIPADIDTLLGRITAAVALASICTEARLAELDAGNLPTDIADIPTVAEFNARTLVAASYFDPGADTVVDVTNVAAISAGAIVATSLAASALTAISFDVWEEILTGATHNVATSAGRIVRELSEQIGYAGGAIWIDTVNGAAGSVVGENGTVNNPVDNITDALALAVAIGITRMRVASGSTITLLAATEGYEIFNANWTLVLNSQSVSGSCIIGASVSGICTGAIQPDFIDCQFVNATLPPSLLTRCSLGGTVIAGSAGTFFFNGCYSAVAGTNAPVFNFGAGLNASNVNFRHYSGGIEIQNMGAGSGTYNMSLEGWGQLIINANCSATSTVAIRGHFTVTDNAGGAIVPSDDARFDVVQINDQILDVMNVDTFAEPGQGAPATTTTIQAKIAYLYKVMRNKLEQTATTLSIYNDAGAVVDHKATVSDDGTTFTRGEIGTGP